MAQPKADGTIAIEAAAVALGVGFAWGEGTLQLENGKRYTFTLQGLEVGSIGVAQVQARGEVYNLESVAAFPGLYVGAEANIAVGRGPGELTLRNERGVVIHLASVQAGSKLTLAAEGVRISLTE